MRTPLDPEDIRGWMSMEEVSQATGIPLDYIYTTADLSFDIRGDIPLSELEKITDFETDDMRELVRDYYQQYPEIEIKPAEDPSFTRQGGRALLDVRVEVLLYHDLAPGGCDQWPVICQEDFRHHLELLLDEGWQPLTLEDFALWQAGEKHLDSNSFLLTFDDGAESVYHYAYPLLKNIGR